MVDTLPPSNAPVGMEPWVKAMEQRVAGTETLVRQTASQTQAASSVASSAADSAGQANNQIADTQRIPTQVGGLTLAGVAYYDNEGISRAYLNVSWSAVTEAIDGSPLVGVQYEVWYRNQNEPVVAMRRSTLTPELTTRINNLESGMGYYVQVRAVSASGVTGDYSITQSTVTPTVTTVPPTPTPPAVSSALGVVAASWNGLTMPVGDPMPNWVTKVQLFVSTTSGGTYVPVGPPLSKSGSVSVTGLTVGSTYYFKLGAYSYSGVLSDLSPVASSIVQGIAPVDITGLTANLAAMNANTANAFAQANTAFSNANAAFTQANSAFGQANSAYGQANTATTAASNAQANAVAAQAAATAAQLAADTLLAQSPEYVVNGGFETPTTWWVMTGSASYATTLSHTGVRNGLVTGSTGEIKTPMIATTAGRRWRVTYWLYTQAAPTGGLRIANASDVTIGTLTTSFPNTSSAWVKQTYDFTVPAGTTEFKVRFAASAGSFRIDDVSLLDISDAYAAQVAADAANANAIAANNLATAANTNATAAYARANTAYGQANSAFNQANTANTAAAAAQVSANGKNRTYTSASPASGTSYTEGDLWYQNVSGATVGMWRFTSGAWVAQPLGYQAIASVDAGTISVGFLSGQRLQANSVDGNVITANTLYANNVIVPNTIIANDLIVPGTILAGLLGVSAVVTNNIQTGAITADKMNVNSVSATSIQSDAVLANHIKAGEIQVNHLAPGVGGQLDISANDSVNILVGQLANVQDDVDSTSANLDAMQTVYQFGPSGALISSPDSTFALALDNDSIEILQDNAVVSYWNSGTMFVNSFVGEQVVLGNHKIEKYGTGTVVRTL